MGMTLKQFVDHVADRAPVPGGGSVSALVAALGASLSTMVGLLSCGNKKFQHLDAQMRHIVPSLYSAKSALLPAVDADSSAFAAYVEACKLPSEDAQQSARRAAAMEQGLLNAISVPMNVAKLSNGLWPAMKDLSLVCNVACKSDLQVAAKSLETGVFGARCNVLINLSNVADKAQSEALRSEAEAEWKQAQERCAEVLQILEGRTG